MRSFYTIVLLITLLLAACKTANDKNDLVVSKVETMIEVVETGKLPLYKKLAREIDYMLLDSVKDRGYLYVAVDPREQLDRMTCSTDDELKARNIFYTTTKEEIYLAMKEKIKSLGFSYTPPDTSNKERIDAFEMFKKGQIDISSGSRLKNKTVKVYSFMFMKTDTAQMLYEMGQPYDSKLYN